MIWPGAIVEAGAGRTPGITWPLAIAGAPARANPCAACLAPARSSPGATQPPSPAAICIGICAQPGARPSAPAPARDSAVIAPAIGAGQRALMAMVPGVTAWPIRDRAGPTGTGPSFRLRARANCSSEKMGLVMAAPAIESGVGPGPYWATVVSVDACCHFERAIISRFAATSGVGCLPGFNRRQVRISA